MRAEFGKHGPKHDYRGAQAVLQWDGRTLLGDVREVYRSSFSSYWRAKVTHFNGEPWPIEPVLMALEILPRR
jgi:hypothetical protein